MSISYVLLQWNMDANYHFAGYKSISSFLVGFFFRKGFWFFQGPNPSPSFFNIS